MIGLSSLAVSVSSGVLGGLGVLFLVRAAHRSSPGRSLARWRSGVSSSAVVPSVRPIGYTWWHACLRQAGRTRSESVTCDRAVMEWSAEAHAVHRVVATLTGVVGMFAVCLALAALGIRLAVPVFAMLLVASGAAGFLAIDHRLRRRAKARRTDVVAALSAYLDLVTVLLAGGGGLETALTAAARSGDGYTFTQIRRVLVHTRSHRQSVWGGFMEFGRSIGVGEFVELGAALQLAGQEGARIASTLSARAASLRARVLSTVEADAQSASERMGLPTVVMFVGFLVLLGYPAVQIILGSA